MFWALYNAKTDQGCTTPALYLAESSDGYAWTVVSQPVITKGVTATLQDIVYRSTFEYDPVSDALTFWISGARFERGRYHWGAVVERRHRASSFAPPRRPCSTPVTSLPRPLRSKTGRSRFTFMTTLPERFAADPRAASALPDAARIEQESRIVGELMTELGRVIVGQRAMLERLLIGLLADGHVLLEGVPGLAKTLSVRTLASTIAAPVPPHPVHARPAAGRSDRHA